MTDDFIKLLQECPLHRRTPFMIRSVSTTQFSIARHYGGIKFNNCDYTYNSDTDEFVRDDVLAWIQKQIKATQKTSKPVVEKQQNQLSLWKNELDKQTEKPDKQQQE